MKTFYRPGNPLNARRDSHGNCEEGGSGQEGRARKEGGPGQEGRRTGEESCSPGQEGRCTREEGSCSGQEGRCTRQEAHPQRRLHEGFDPERSFGCHRR